VARLVARHVMAELLTISARLTYAGQRKDKKRIPVRLTASRIIKQGRGDREPYDR
jgi:hypothetical protein